MATQREDTAQHSTEGGLTGIWNRLPPVQSGVGISWASMQADGVSTQDVHAIVDCAKN